MKCRYALAWRRGGWAASGAGLLASVLIGLVAALGPARGAQASVATHGVDEVTVYRPAARAGVKTSPVRARKAGVTKKRAAVTAAPDASAAPTPKARRVQASPAPSGSAAKASTTNATARHATTTNATGRDATTTNATARRAATQKATTQKAAAARANPATTATPKETPSTAPASVAHIEGDGNTTMLSASFSPATIGSSEHSDLIFHLAWDDGAGDSTNVAFTVALPSGVQTVGSGSSWYDTQCGGTVSRPVAGSVRLAGATVPNSGSCTFTVHVTALQAATYTVTDSDVSDKNANLSPSFTATLAVTAQAYLIGVFIPPNTVGVGETAHLGLVVVNPSLSSVTSGYTATLPAHLKVAAGMATPAPCAGTVTAPAGGSVITVSGGTTIPSGIIGCGALIPVVPDTVGTYYTSDIAISAASGIQATITDVFPCIGPCPPFEPTLTVTPPKQPQTITFGAIPDAALTAGTVALGGSASSSLTLAYTSETTSVCTVTGPTVTLLTTGTCTITAAQEGDATYSAATSVSQSFTVLPQAQPPTSVTATAGTSSITVHWTAPGTTTGITGYTATAQPGPATCTTSSVSDTTCVLGATAGTRYTVTVVARSRGGDSTPAGPSNEVTVTAPVPPTSGPPATNLTLTTDHGQISTAAPGQEITFIGTGFAAHSTVVISIYSSPTVLGTVVTDASGDFATPITIPQGLLTGAHTAVAQGVAPDGTARAMNLAITVAPRRLPVTGAAVSVLLLTGLGSTAAGVGLLVAARRGRSRRYRTT
jgi:hypothetical protein